MKRRAETDLERANAAMRRTLELTARAEEAEVDQHVDLYVRLAQERRQAEHRELCAWAAAGQLEQLQQRLQDCQDFHVMQSQSICAAAVRHAAHTGNIDVLIWALEHLYHSAAHRTGPDDALDRRRFWAPLFNGSATAVVALQALAAHRRRPVNAHNLYFHAHNYPIASELFCPPLITRTTPLLIVVALWQGLGQHEHEERRTFVDALIQHRHADGLEFALANEPVLVQDRVQRLYYTDRIVVRHQWDRWLRLFRALPSLFTPATQRRLADAQLAAAVEIGRHQDCIEGRPSYPFNAQHIAQLIADYLF